MIQETEFDLRGRRIAFTAAMPSADLLDAAEDVGRLIDRDDLDLTPAMRDLLFAVDEAITDAFH